MGNKLKLYGFNNLTKALSFNIYDVQVQKLRGNKGIISPTLMSSIIRKDFNKNSAASGYGYDWCHST